MFERVSLKDSNVSAVASYNECKKGFSLRDAQPAMFNAMYSTEAARKLHDANFAFVQTTLSKLHEKVYEPKTNTTYAKDVPISVGGGLVDFVDFYSVEWAGMPTQDQNLMGNNVNVVPRVNAKLVHTAVDVHNFEIAYDMKFIEVDKLKKVAFQKSIEAIYKDAIMAGWDLFCDKIAYEGTNGDNGLLTSDAKVAVTVIPAGTQDATKEGFKQMTDVEIVGIINGILSYYLVNTNNNIDLLPDTILMPTTDAAELSSRFSTLYTNTLRQFLMNFNVGIDEAVAAGVENFKLKLKGRGRLNGKGTLKGGRLVAYKMDKDYVRMDIPYPVQLYYTAPNMDRAAYTSIFVGQVSDIQLPYNESNASMGAVSYWDFTAAADKEVVGG